MPNAIALNSLQFNLSRAVGPILCGGSLAYFDASTTFALNAASFLALVAAFAFIRNVPPVKASSLFGAIAALVPAKQQWPFGGPPARGI